MGSILLVVGQWKKEILESASTLFDTRRGPKPAEADTGKRRSSHGEIGRLKMEVDWLKKVEFVSPLVRRGWIDGRDRLPCVDSVLADLSARHGLSTTVSSE